MSFDISLIVPACPECCRPTETIDVADPTYNLGLMWREAFDGDQGIRGLNGLSAAEVMLRVKVAIERMLAAPEQYRKLQPDNGWGDYEGAVDVLQRLLTKCHRYPTATVMVR